MKRAQASLLEYLFMTLFTASMLVACGGGSDAASKMGSTVPTPVGVPSGSTLQALGQNSLGQASNADGYYPDAAGLYPNVQGIYPDKSGNYPSTEQVGLYENETDIGRHYSTAGSIDKNNTFFKPFGNGRSCASCHQQSDGFSVIPKHIEERFRDSNGNDPLFMRNDGANSPLATKGNLNEKRLASSMLIGKGLIPLEIIPRVKSRPNAVFQNFLKNVL
jgi:hypothetical protein